MGEKPRYPLIRDVDAAQNLEILLVSAIVTIFVTRIYLHLTGFPQIGGGTLHIAHMLWGGLLMLAGLMMLISYLNFSVRVAASLIAGIGFGLFIDELGKFVTADHDYFFRPTFALLYVMFVGLFLIVRALFWVVPLSAQERVVNRDLRANPFLTGRSDSRAVALYLAATERVKKVYQVAVDRPWFRGGLVTVFAAISLGHLGTAVATFLDRHEQLGVANGIYLASAVVSGLFVLAGLIQLRLFRLRGLRYLRMAMLVSIFVSQIFLFYENELAAVGGLVVDLVTYLALSTMIRIEKHQADT